MLTRGLEGEITDEYADETAGLGLDNGSIGNDSAMVLGRFESIFVSWVTSVFPCLGYPIS